jgi:hypothetical protein
MKSNPVEEIRKKWKTGQEKNREYEASGRVKMDGVEYEVTISAKSLRYGTFFVRGAELGKHRRWFGLFKYGMVVEVNEVISDPNNRYNGAKAVMDSLVELYNLKVS